MLSRNGRHAIRRHDHGAGRRLTTSAAASRLVLGPASFHLMPALASEDVRPESGK